MADLSLSLAVVNVWIEGRLHLAEILTSLAFAFAFFLTLLEKSDLQNKNA